MKTTIIGIAGGSASGKTTLAKKVSELTEDYGSVVVLKLDDYYKESHEKNIEERAKINFDHPDSYDSNLLIEHLNDLKMGKCINRPTYDFVNHNRSKEKVLIKPANVIIVEGIMIFAIPELLKMFDIKIFVETPSDIRFIRRLTRDTKERGRTIDSVINQYLATVRPMHLTFVEPSKRYADIIIPSESNNDIAIDFIKTKIVNLIEKDK